MRVIIATLAATLLAATFVSTEAAARPGGMHAGGFHAGGFHGGMAFRGGFASRPAAIGIRSGGFVRPAAVGGFAVRPAGVAFHRGGFGFRHHRFHRFGPRFAFVGAPLLYSAWPSYAYADDCLAPRRVWTPWGWRIRLVNVCYY